MRRLCALSAIFLLSAGIFLGGCKRPTQQPEDDKKQVEIEPPKVKVDPPVVEPKKKIDAPVKPIAEDKQDKLEAALADAIGKLQERQWPEALKAFELANTIQETDFAKGEIARLKERIGQEGVAKNAIKNIKAVLDDGNAEDAAKLANDALKEFGDGDDAARLTALRIQADAIRNAEKKDSGDVRYARFKKEGDAAIAEKNLRAAALAYEQAVEAKADADLQKTAEELRAKLDEYDTLRKKGTELRGDPATLDDALAAFKAAALAWDTLQIRTDIDDCRLALEKKRETVAVADFELRNDVGMPGAGAALAEELLPRLKAKFDLVERGQLQRVLGELNVQKSFLDDPKQQQAIGKGARARYLVVGSVQRLVGVTVRARLVDVQTGLIVQTGKIIAPTMEEVIQQIPDLAKQLMMNDEAKLAFDKGAQEKAARPVEKAPDNAVIPPAPKAPAAGAVLPPPPIANPAPPVFVKAKANAFNFAAPPATFVAPPVDPLAGASRNRLLSATLEMGDYLFAARRYREAQRQFEFALMLAPNNIELQLRVERCRPFVPPPMFFTPQPRIAVLPFMTVGNPFVVSPTLGYWTPANLSPYFGYRYDVVDPAEVYWYMGRMGLTMNDLLVDPSARRWLGRAIGVRYFVFGSLIETTSFDVNTYLIDAEFGYLQGGARVNVSGFRELKLRLPEIAELTMMTPVEQAAYLAQKQQQRFFALVAAGRRHQDQGRYDEAVREFEAALALDRWNVQVRVLLEHARSQARFAAYERERRQALAAQAAAAAAQRQRQIELARAAEAARQRALADAAARNEAQRSARLAVRIDAQNNLVTRAEVAVKSKNFGLSVGLFQGAIGLTPPSATPPAVNNPALAQARLEAERAEQTRLAQFNAARETALRLERDKQLAVAQKQLASERAAAQAKLEAERAAQVKRDDQVYQASIDQGLKEMGASKYESALVAFQAAQRLANTPQQHEKVNNLIDIVVQRQAESLAKTKDEKAALERKLALERERKLEAEKQRKGNEAKYQTALTAAQTALAAKNYDAAQAKFEEAGQVFRTDAVLNGLKSIEAARAAAVAATKQAEAALAKAKVEELIKTGLAALKSRNYDAAEKALRSASQVDPTNPTIAQGLKDIETGRKAVATDKQRQESYNAALTLGQKAFASKDFKGAIKSAEEALKWAPNDATAGKLLQQALTAQGQAEKAIAAFDNAMTAGRKAMTAKTYDAAAKAFSVALQYQPKNVEATQGLADAQRALAETQRAVSFQKAMTAGQTAMKVKKYQEAVNSFQQAVKLMPTDAKAQQQLQQARDALRDSMKKTAEPPKADYDTAMQRGAAAENDQRYSDALKAYQEAQQAKPKDKLASSRVQVAQAIVNGEQAINAKMWMDAVRELDNALRIQPKNAYALKLMQKAKNKGK